MGGATGAALGPQGGEDLKLFSESRSVCVCQMVWRAVYGEVAAEEVWHSRWSFYVFTTPNHRAGWPAASITYDHTWMLLRNPFCIVPKIQVHTITLTDVWRIETNMLERQRSTISCSTRRLADVLGLGGR